MTGTGFPRDNVCHHVEKAKVLGVHKQQHDKISHHFIVVGIWSDKSQVTVYRKLRQIRSFQKDIMQCHKVSGGNDDSKRCLKKVSRGLNNTMRSGRGTMGKLKMIDSLNNFLSVITHYEELAQSQIMSNFFKPTEIDTTSMIWSKDGKTYMYVPRDTLGRNNKNAESDDEQEIFGDDLNKSIGLDSAGEETHDHDYDTDSSSKDKFLPQSSTVSYIALADFEGDSTSFGKDSISIHKDEEVEVVEQDKSGWWLVRKSSEDSESDNSPCGYVPASYLRQSTSDESNDSFYAVDDNSQQLPVFGPTMLIPEEVVDFDLPGVAFGSDSPKLTKSIVNKLRREFTFDSSDSEVSDITRSSEEINEMGDGLRGMNGTAECRSATSSPFGRRRQSNVMENLELRSRRRNTLALSTFGTLFKPTEGSITQPKYIRRQTIADISTGPDNLFRGSSTGNIASLIGEDYIAKESYEAISSDEISFSKGSVLKVLRRNKNGWWLASYDKKTGVVPGVHLQRYQDPIRKLSLRMLDLI